MVSPIIAMNPNPRGGHPSPLDDKALKFYTFIYTLGKVSKSCLPLFNKLNKILEFPLLASTS